MLWLLAGCEAAPVFPTQRVASPASDAGQTGLTTTDAGSVRAAPPTMYTSYDASVPAYDASVPDAAVSGYDASVSDAALGTVVMEVPMHPVPECRPDGAGGSLSCTGYTRCLPALWNYAQTQNPGCAGPWFDTFDQYQSVFMSSCAGMVSWSATFNCSG